MRTTLALFLRIHLAVFFATEPAVALRTAGPRLDRNSCRTIEHAAERNTV